MWGDIVKIIVDADELQHIAAKIDMYADLLDDVEGYADEIKNATADLREIADLAEPVKGE